MDLTTHVEALRQHLIAAAESGGSESVASIERLSGGLDAATRLVLLEAVSAAADEITRELVPGSVEVRLRGSNPEFVVTLPSYEADNTPIGAVAPPTVFTEGEDEGSTSRLNLRLPEGLKTKIEEAARREGLSLNAWLVRTAATAVERPHNQMTPTPPGANQRYTGWVR